MHTPRTVYREPSRRNVNIHEMLLLPIHKSYLLSHHSQSHEWEEKRKQQKKQNPHPFKGAAISTCPLAPAAVMVTLGRQRTRVEEAESCAHVSINLGTCQCAARIELLLCIIVYGSLEPEPKKTCCPSSFTKVNRRLSSQPEGQENWLKKNI